MNSLIQRKHQNGAALVVGLILLMVITILAISGMNTATTELAMARNDQNYENAFQAAETGLERALSQGSFNTLTETAMPKYDIDANRHDSVTAKKVGPRSLSSLGIRLADFPNRHFGSSSRRDNE